jgi:membrane associated rhomboid family serine protease
MMTESLPTPDTLLRLCAAAEPGPWFPSEYARTAGIDRDSLDEPLNQLRIAGLVRIGGWEAGRGQYYVLTEDGRAAVADPQARRRPAAKLRPPRKRKADRRQTVAGATTWERGEAVRAAFIPRGMMSPVLFTLVAVQIFVFAAGMALAMRRHDPLNVYIKAGQPTIHRLVLDLPDLARGEWWRLVTYAFVHFGALHLAMNLYGHFALGGLLERMYGPVRFLALYLLSALGGGVAAALLSSEHAITAGSSGALCGLIGGFASFVFLNRGHLGRELFDYCRRWLANTVVLLVLFSMVPNVSWQGHLGGFVAGLVAGVLLTYHRFGTAEQRWAALLGVLLLPIAGIAPLVEKGILRWSPPPPLLTPAEAERTPVADEWDSFRKLVGLPTENARDLFARQRDNFIDELRYHSPATRDPNRVQASHMLLALSRKNMQTARVLAEQAGPFQKPLLEPARGAALEYARAAESAANAMDQCFTRGDKWQISADPNDPKATDEMRLQQLLNEMLEKELVWRGWVVKTLTAYDPQRLPLLKTAQTAPGGAPVPKPNAAPGQAR